MRKSRSERPKGSGKTAGCAPGTGCSNKRVRRYRFVRKERRGPCRGSVVCDLEEQAVVFFCQPAVTGLEQHQRVMLIAPRCRASTPPVFFRRDHRMQSDSVRQTRLGIQIDHVEHDMAGTDDVEGRIERDAAEGHGFPPNGFSHVRDRAVGLGGELFVDVVRSSLVCLSCLMSNDSRTGFAQKHGTR